MNPDSPRRCGSCGSELAPGASFCRSCGTPYEQPSCDACKAPTVPGAAFCRSCGAPVAASAPQAEPTLVRPPPPASPPPPPSEPPARRGRRTPLLIAAAIVLLGAGAAAAIVLTGGGGGESSTITVAEESADTAPADDGEATAADEAETETVEEAVLYPPVGRPEMEDEIETLLLAYHEDVVERDYRSAWALLSSRKRRQNLAEYGYPEWMRAQASLSDDLSPSGLQASIESFEGKREGVARVLVTGMGWSAAGSSCGEWSGLTWVRYEGGEWTYDPGYSTTGARRRAWEPRAGELLGGTC